MVAPICDRSELQRAMLCTEQEGCYVFLYDRIEDGPCAYDYLQDDIIAAKRMCLEAYGIKDSDWTCIPDPPPGCQQDWISQVRLADRSQGGGRSWEFERLQEGEWTPIEANSSEIAEGGPVTSIDDTAARPPQPPLQM
jgi:hypothetical protein